MSRRKEPMIPNELLDQLLAGGAASAAFEQGGLLDSLKKALTERALNAEMDISAPWASRCPMHWRMRCSAGPRNGWRWG